MDAFEEGIYEIVALEIAENRIKVGLYTKALSEADADEAKAKALYIKYRVKQIKEQARSESVARLAAIKNAKKENKKKANGFDVFLYCLVSLSAVWFLYMLISRKFLS